MDPSEKEARQRDAEILRVLGSFFSLMGVLVLIGTFWALGKTSAVVVSICSGSVLLAIGLVMLRRLGRPS